MLQLIYTYNTELEFIFSEVRELYDTQTSSEDHIHVDYTNQEQVEERQPEERELYDTQTSSEDHIHRGSYTSGHFI